VLLDYFARMIEECDGNPAWYMGRIKKVVSYFTCGLPHGARLRKSIHRSQTIDAIRRLVARYFELLAEHRVRDAFRELHDEEAEIAAGSAMTLTAATTPG
jgi:hypothetical protein